MFKDNDLRLSGFHRFEWSAPLSLPSASPCRATAGLSDGSAKPRWRAGLPGRIGGVQTLSKGANASLPSGPVAVTVVAASPVDISALLLTEARKVRSDADFVFYNQPLAPGVGYRPDGVDIDPSRLEPAIECVTVTASLDDSGPATFGALGGLRMDVAVGGTPVATFSPDGLGSETALLCVEVYQRNGQWKVRAVGQGYSSGLAGIATDFGISIDEPGPSPAPPPTGSQVPLPPPTGAPAHLPPPSGAPANLPPPSGPPVQAGAPPAFGQAAGSPGPPPSWNAPPPAASAPDQGSSGKLTLDKGPVSLAKRQTVSLTKGGASTLRRVAMGLGWDPAAGARSVDLDASAIVIDTRGKKLDAAWFMGKSACRGAVLHSGDNLTGRGDGDDETITVTLDALPPEAAAVVFTVNSYQGQKFTQVSRAFCRLIDLDTGAELVRFDLSESKPQTGVIMSVLRRNGAAWEMTAIGEFHDGKTARAMYRPAEAVVASLGATGSAGMPPGW